MKKLGFLLSVVLLLAGCKEDQSKEQARFYENGHAKPVVAIVPLIDNSRHKLSWNVSDEITALVHYRLMQKDSLYLVDEEKVDLMLKRMKETHHPFDLDLTWMKKIFNDDEFVVFLELIDHEEKAIAAKEAIPEDQLPAELTLQVRIRVIDLRGEQPKITLQEIIKDSHTIPSQFRSSHFTQVEWEKENYSISPIGIAHAHIAKEIATRLEDYILLSVK